jgi:hypothetical protein
LRLRHGNIPSPALADSVPDDGEDSFTTSRKKNWARLMRKILEVDPLLCARCGATMKVIAGITDAATVDTSTAACRRSRRTTNREQFRTSSSSSELTNTIATARVLRANRG